MAGKTPKNWDFQLNDEGECVVEKAFTTSKDAVTAIKAVKAVINKQPFENRKLETQEENSLVYSLKKNTKTRYNPFAGNFNEAMEFRMTVTYADGQVLITLTELSIENRYQGYGQKVQNETFSGRISDYEEAVQRIATAKGKEKKEAENTIEQVNDSLNTCQEELDNIFTAIEESL